VSRIKILDCTLRDGGYVNEWNFGEGNIKYIISNLVESGVEIIECGFLSDKRKLTKDYTILIRLNN
jgi:4-hydroxy 2-oxovalerate aldolase